MILFLALFAMLAIAQEAPKRYDRQALDDLLRQDFGTSEKPSPKSPDYSDLLIPDECRRLSAHSQEQKECIRTTNERRSAIERNRREQGNLMSMAATVMFVTALFVIYSARKKIASAFQCATIRAITAGSLIWILGAQSWGLIFRWGSIFGDEEWLALNVLPPIVATISFILWRWVKRGQKLSPRK